MKQIFISLAAALLLAGCAKSGSPAPSPEPVPPSSSLAPAEDVAPNEPAPEEPEPEEPPEDDLLASASTELLDKSENRISNIKTAASQISGLVLSPGEAFSFNGVVGARTAENGYKKAPIIAHGEKEMEYGGGVCQLATTLYQAANRAGLQIDERHNHQKDVGYAEQGSDAAINYGTMDLKFTNSGDFPVQLAALVGEDVVTVEIYRLD